jgi:predicted ABC-type transport system involved in lysophospholipase L1 biosynthesis ATPase subunit
VRNRAIGVIFQSFNLIGDLTVAENVELPLTYRGLTPAERSVASCVSCSGSRVGPSGTRRISSTFQASNVRDSHA